MLKSDLITSNKLLPKSITSHEIFSKYQSFDKIFPHIGLKNFSLNFRNAIDNNLSLIRYAADELKFYKTKHNNIWYNIIANTLGYICVPIDYFLNKKDINEFVKSIDKKDLTVNFSSTNFEGAWDLATMSMRGLTSCQSWTSTLARNLVGSIVDPCCGIIYIAEKELKNKGLGSDMLYRAIVRYVIHNNVGPCLYIERIYSHRNLLDKERFALKAIFAGLLRNRINLPIFCETDLEIINKMSIPAVKEIKLVLDNTDSNSYRDSGIKYTIDISPQSKYKTMKIFINKFIKNT